MKQALIACFVFGVCSAHSAELTNETITDVIVECPGRPDVEVLPGRSATVEFCNPQWLRMGQEAALFNFGPRTQKVLSLGATRVRVGTNGWIYIRPEGGREIRVSPKKKIDLT